MGVVNGIITETGVSLSDVARVLGAASTDLGRLCTHPNVNMWSKYKPIDADVIGELTDSQRHALAYGLSVENVGGYVTNMQSKAQIYSILTRQWQYRQPTGGSHSPYRIADFRKYYHDAEPPIEAQIPSQGLSVNLDDQSRVTVYISVVPDRPNGQYEIQGDELVDCGIDLRDYRFVWLVKDPTLSGSSNDSFPAVGITPVEDGNVLDRYGNENTDSITIDFDGVSTLAKPYELYIGLAKFDDGRFWVIPLPNGKGSSMNQMPFKVRVYSDPTAGGGIVDALNNVFFSYALDAVFRTANQCTDEGTSQNKYALRTATGDIYVKVVLTNSSRNETTISRTDLEMYVNDSNAAAVQAVHPDMIYSESGDSISSITIPAGGSTTCTMSFAGLLQKMNYSNVGDVVEMDLRRKNKSGVMIEIWNGALRVHKGSVSEWVEM
mgnify:CR=1 FL=1